MFATSSKTWPPRATKETKRASSKVQQRRNVACIDFGTTFCSLAYATSGHIANLKLNEYYHGARVPNAILFRERGNCSDTTIGNGYEVVEFGFAAQDAYSSLKPSDHETFVYFERVKLGLLRDEIDRNMKIRALGGGEFYMVEVVAFILKYLKEKFERELKRVCPRNQLTSTDFSWVITVPALWKARGREMMREAAYKAGLCSSTEEIDLLRPATKGVPRPKESHLDNLTLAFEPDAAAFYCQNMTEKNAADYCTCKEAESYRSRNYLVIDIGGGTVDITAHRVNVTKEIDIVQVPKGNSYGGCTVNRKFSKFLQMVLEGEDENPLIPSAEKENEARTLSNPSPELELSFPKLFAEAENEADRNIFRAALNELVYKEFEKQKVIFGEEADGTVEKLTNSEQVLSVTIPRELVEAYKAKNIDKAVKMLKDNRVEFKPRYNKLFITYSKMQEFFEPSVSGILDAAIAALPKQKGQIDTLYIVGGFGGCKYIYEKLATKIGTEHGDAIRLVVPKDYSMAVAQGGVHYLQHQESIHSWCADATYGIEVSVPYNSSIPDHYLNYDEDGEDVCKGAFLVFVEEGETVTTRDEFMVELKPEKQKNRDINIAFYSTSQEILCFKDTEGLTQIPCFIKDTNGRNLARQVGEIRARVPEHDFLHRDQRIFRLVLHCIHPDLRATLRYMDTGKEERAFLDLLSDV